MAGFLVAVTGGVLSASSTEADGGAIVVQSRDLVLVDGGRLEAVGDSRASSVACSRSQNHPGRSR